jgi:predicted ester cyclase
MADYKEMAQRWYSEVMSEGKTGAMTSSARELSRPRSAPGTSADLAGLKDFVAQIRAAFPDMQVTAEDMIAEGDRLAVRRPCAAPTRATSWESWQRQEVEVSNHDFVRFENDQAVEHWGVIDSAALMEQIGMAPAGS